MKSLGLIVALLVVLTADVAACSSVTTGQVAPQPDSSTVAGSSQPAATTSPPTSNLSKGSGTLAEIDACKLITRQEGQQYQISGVERLDIGGARGCQYDTADSEFVLTIGIREQQGLSDFNNGYGKTTDAQIKSYPAKKQLTPGGGCLIAVAFTTSSRIDVIVSASGDETKACKLSREFAELVASKVTPG